MLKKRVRGEFSESAKKSHMNAQTEGSIKNKNYMGLYRVFCTYIITFSLALLCTAECVSESCHCSWDSFPSVGLPYPGSIWWLFFFILIVMLGCYLLEACSSLMKDWKGDDPEKQNKTKQNKRKQEVERIWEEGANEKKL